MRYKLPTKKELEAIRNMPTKKILKAYKKCLDSGEYKLAKRLMWIAGYWKKELFCLTYMPDMVTAPFKPYHLQILDAIPNGVRNRNINILAPRNSSKTTLVTLVYPLHRILYAPFDKIMGFYVEKFIVQIHQSTPKMVRRMRMLADQFKKNSLIKRDFGDRSDHDDVWAKDEFRVMLGMKDEVAIVVGLTRGTEIRGENVDFVRPTLVLIDDIDVIKDLQNPDLREEDRSWFFSDVMPAGVPNITNFMFIDTLKHEDALSANLRENPAWRTIFLRAFEEPAKLKPHPTQESLWERWENIYANIANPNRQDDADNFYQKHKIEMDKGIKSLWPEMITYKMIREYIVSRGYDYVLREYQNDISFTTFRMFEMDRASRFLIEDDGLWITDKRLPEETSHVQWDDIVGVSIYHDWAGGQDISKNDFSAILAVAWTKKVEGIEAIDSRDSMNGQYGYVIDARLEREPQTSQIRSIFDIAERIMHTFIKVPNLKIKIGYEKIIDGTQTANQFYRRSFIRERERRSPQCDKLTIQAIDQKGIAKNERIDTLAGPINFGWLSFNYELDPEFIRQLSMYPVADHDDGPDALQGATRMELRPASPKINLSDPYNEHDEFDDRLKLGNW